MSQGEKSVGDIRKVLGEEESRVSHELRCLTACSLVSFTKDGKRMVYSLDGSTVTPTLDTAGNHVLKLEGRMDDCSMVSDARRRSRS